VDGNALAACFDDGITDELVQLIAKRNPLRAVYSVDQLPKFENGRIPKQNPLNANYHKKAFGELWSRIHQKAVYSVHFKTAELITKCVAALDAEQKVAPLQYVVERGQQTAETTYEALQAGNAFQREQTQTARLNASVHSAMQYDLIGKLANETTLTRATIGAILQQIKPSVFKFYRVNPEDFLRVAARLVNEQKATVIVEHLRFRKTSQNHPPQARVDPSVWLSQDCGRRTESWMAESARPVVSHTCSGSDLIISRKGSIRVHHLANERNGTAAVRGHRDRHIVAENLAGRNRRGRKAIRSCEIGRSCSLIDTITVWPRLGDCHAHWHRNFGYRDKSSRVRVRV
jgi:hypothetical protein